MILINLTSLNWKQTLFSAGALRVFQVEGAELLERHSEGLTYKK